MNKRNMRMAGLALGAAPLALTGTSAHAGTTTVVPPVLVQPSASTMTVPATQATASTASGSVSTSVEPATTPVPSAVTVPVPTPSASSGTAPFTAQAADIEPKWGSIRSFWGSIRSFQGEEVSPFWGTIRSFWGDLSPYEGNTTAFWGNLQTFNTGTTTTTKTGVVAPQWGSIRSFWQDLGTTWASTRTVWDSGDYKATATRLQGIVASSAQLWGDAVKAGTGKDFQTGFASPLLAKYGIVLNDPSSLAKLDANTREHFFVEWYDGLMQFSGADHADYWMRMVNWSPALTQLGGKTGDSVIGLLDFSVDDATAALKIKSRKGVSEVDNGHGAAVASLMVAPHDGVGIMGVSPYAKVIAYNPFDATQTAGWSDIKDGINDLVSHKASVINMSLGVSGWTLHPEWNDVLADAAIAKGTAKTIFVMAAGNDGITQTNNIAWTNSANFIIVGSIDPAANISEFSNRPGSTCLVKNATCDPLMNHFMVAPGEMMLVSDGQGGVTRYSGTSFAAPLVSGTIGLIHDRWPWLANYPAETVKIILDSAKDLGAPGIDPIYGVGMLDVTAALTPLDYTKLTWYRMDDSMHAQPMTTAAITSASAGQLASWNATGMSFRAFETIGGTYRDFDVPLASKLVDSQLLAATRSRELFQAYLYNASVGSVKTSLALTDRPMLNYLGTSTAVPSAHGMKLIMSVAPRSAQAGDNRRGFNSVQTALKLTSEDDRLALKMGDGDGAIELGNASGLTRASDYDRAGGGANPLLGMASGGNYVQASYAVVHELSVSFGVTQQNTRYDRRGLSSVEASNFGSLDGYRTSASTMGVTWRPSTRLELNGSYTRLHERDAILGVQSLANDLLGTGATTQGMTLAASYQLTRTLQASGSATMGRTGSASSNALVATGSGGLRSSAYQFSLAKQNLFDRKDALRISMSQPLHVDRGNLDVSSVQVVDRETGELGLVTQRFALPGTKRRMVGEFQYSRSVMEGQADVALFGRAQLRGDDTLNQTARLMAGAILRLQY